MGHGLANPSPRRREARAGREKIEDLRPARTPDPDETAHFHVNESTLFTDVSDGAEFIIIRTNWGL